MSNQALMHPSEPSQMDRPRRGKVRHRVAVGLLVLGVVALLVGAIVLARRGLTRGAPGRPLQTRSGWVAMWSSPERDSAPSALAALQMGVRVRTPAGKSASAGPITPLAENGDGTQAVALVVLDASASTFSVAEHEGALGLYWVVATSGVWVAMDPTLGVAAVGGGRCGGSSTLLAGKANEVAVCGGGVGEENVAARDGQTAIAALGTWPLADPQGAQLAVTRVRSFGAPLAVACPPASALTTTGGACVSSLVGSGPNAELRLSLVLGLEDAQRANDLAQAALDDADTLLAW